MAKILLHGILKILLPMFSSSDADPGLQDPVLWRQYTNTHGLQKSCGEKGMAQLLSQGKSAPTLALTGFYCFSGHITLRMVLIYYAQVCFRWLPFTENKGKDVANYIKKEGYLQIVKGKVIELVTLILGRFSLDFRKLL